MEERTKEEGNKDRAKEPETSRYPAERQAGSQKDKQVARETMKTDVVLDLGPNIPFPQRSVFEAASASTPVDGRWWPNLVTDMLM